MRLGSLDEILRFVIRKEADEAAFYRLAVDRSRPGAKKAFEALAKEEKFQRFYTSTAKIVTEPKLKKLLLILAQEESAHKERLEKIYDDEILKEF